MLFSLFLCQAEDGIRDRVRSRGLGDVYKRQAMNIENEFRHVSHPDEIPDFCNLLFVCE